jgi:HEAT repeat protein
MGTFVVALGVLGFVALRAFSEPPEPTYQGKTLSHYLSLLSEDPERKMIILTNESPPEGFTPEFAIRQMGTNAVPVLIQMLTREESSLESRFFGLAQKQSVIKFQHLPEGTRRRRAAMGFQVLGPLASNAVPSLIQAAGHTNWDIRLYTVAALGKIHSEPQISVPALVKALRDPQLLVRLYAAASLAEFGPDAHEAVPALVQIIETDRATFTNVAVWRTGPSTSEESAMDALKKIDPATAAKIVSGLTTTRPVNQWP